MLQQANSAIPQYLPQADAVQHWAASRIDAAKEQVIAILAAAESKIHITFDLWTSPNGHGMLGVIAHAVLNIEKPVNAAITLALRKVRGHHSGEVIAQVLAGVLHEYKINPARLGVFIADNTSSNDTAVTHLCELLDIAPDHRRGRCIEHIFNLASKALMFGKDLKAFESEIEAQEQSSLMATEQLEDARKAWRTKGSIGKLHNVILFMKRSDPRRDEFRGIATGNPAVDSNSAILYKNLAAEVDLTSDNSTSWNSYYYSFRRALEVKEPINTLITRYNKELRKDRLSEEEWEEIQQVCDALAPFETMTKELQSHAGDGQHGSVWERLPAIEVLLKEMERGLQVQREAGKLTSVLAVGYHNVWEKLKHYYELSDDDYEIYGAATILAPGCRQAYFNANWAEGELPQYRPILFNRVQKLWTERYKDDEHISKKQYEPSPLERQLGRGRAVIGDAYEQYATGKPDELGELVDHNLLTWWLRHCPSTQLRKMAWDFLSIPVTSAGVERLFSSAKLLITDLRGRLTVEHIEMYELLRAWWRAGIVAIPDMSSQT